MTSTELERLRVALLQQLRELDDMPFAALLTGARLAGHRELTEAQLRAELAYLGDKGFVAPVAKPLSPENKRWRLAAAGRDFLAESGL